MKSRSRGSVAHDVLRTCSQDVLRTCTQGALCAAAGAALLVPVAVPAQAEGIKVTVNGFVRERFGFADNNEERAAVGKMAAADQQSDNEIHFNARTELDNGIKIRAHVELDANNNSDIIDEQYITISGKFGQLVLGSENSAAYMMQVRPSQAGLGFGETNEWIVDTTGSSGSGDSAIENVQLRFEDNDSDKITYYTPRLLGFQFGASYVPNATQDENSSFATVDDVYGNGVSLGANFKRKFGKVGIGLAAGYATWLDTPTGHIDEEPEGYSLGAQFGIAGFRITGSYINFDNLFDRGGTDPDDSQAGEGYQIGADYRAGPNRFSATYHHGMAEDKTTIVGDDEADIFVIAARRTLGPGVSLALAGMYADYQGESPGIDDDNDGWAVVTELRVDF